MGLGNLLSLPKVVYNAKQCPRGTIRAQSISLAEMGSEQPRPLLSQTLLTAGAESLSS